MSLYNDEPTHYFGYGNSNQLVRTSIPQINTDIGYNGANQNDELYIKDFSKEIAELQTDVSDLQTDVGDLDGRLTVVEGDIVTIQGDILTIQGDITSLEGRMDTAETDIIALQALAHPAVTLGPVGASPNVNAATLTDQLLNLEPASVDYPGVITTNSQVFSGLKQFNGGVKTLNNDILATGTGNIFSDNIVGGEKIQLNSPSTVAGNGCIYFGDATDTNDRLLSMYKGMYFGYQSGNFSTTAPDNTNHGFGESTLRAITTGVNNTAVGYRALYNCTNSTNNVAIGAGALQNITTDTSDWNTCIGSSAGSALTTGNSLIAIGTQCCATASGQFSECIYIGQGHQLGGVHGGGADGDTVIGVWGNNQRVYLPGIKNTGTVIGTPKLGIIDGTSEQLGAGDALTIGSVPNANGMTISHTGLTLQPASGSFGGVVTTSAQTFAGAKTFSTGIYLPTAGGTSALLDYYEANTLFVAGIQMPSGAITGFTMRGSAVAANTWEVIITRIDNMVSIQCKAFKISAGVNGTEIQTVNALPARFRPSYQVNVSIGSFQNGVGNPEETPICYVDTAGVIHFYRYNGGNWDTSNAGSSVADFVIQYHV